MLKFELIQTDKHSTNNWLMLKHHNGDYIEQPNKNDKSNILKSKKFNSNQ